VDDESVDSGSTEVADSVCARKGESEMETGMRLMERSRK